MAKVFLRSIHNYDTEQASNETALKCEDESLAQQNQKEQADINTIVRRFGLTGELPPNPRTPQYGDFTGIRDYQSALNAVMDAQEMFMEYPAELRARFDNDTEKFVNFCLDPANEAEMIKIGLAEAKEEPKVPETQKAPEAPKAP